MFQKLLKYPWKPANEERIARHDASAMRNWRELKEGNLNIPEDLSKHFLKFSERQIPPLSKKSIKVDLTQAQKIGEFEQIIQMCAKKDNVENYIEMPDNQQNSNNEKSNKRVVKDPRRMTLEDLTTRIKERLESGSEVNTPDRIIIDTVSTDKSKFVDNKEIDLISYKQENDLKEYKEPDNKSITLMEYPERIRIPKKAYKKGATYKINDCYYDHDGRFLYRVLGLSE